jgi:hypothetical protein
MRSLFQRLLFTACAVLICGPLVCAQGQGQNPSPPIPAYRPPLAGTGVTEAEENSGQTPQNQPLSGVQPLSLGMETTRSYWQPRFDISGTADSNPQEIGEGQAWDTWTTASAGIDIHQNRGVSDLTLGYTAGGMYSNGNMTANGIIQGLNLADKFSFRRSTLSLFDQASYLPESAFGFGGLGSAGLPTGGLGAPGSAFNPGQTVLTGRGQMLNNSSAVEWDELLTPRSSLTFSGGYSLLRYFGDRTNLFNYGLVNARGGYNYRMTRKDTFAIFYTLGDYRYSDTGQSLVDHSLQISYGRIVTGKLAFQVAAGPQEVLSRSSTSGAGSLSGTGSPTTGFGTQSQLSWSLNSSLQYQERRYGLALSYSHGVGGGSGVLVGAQTDTVTGALTRQMSRTFSSGFTGGYSRSQGLPGAGNVSNQLYDYWFGGVNISEPLGPTLGLTLSYQVQYQTSNSAVCVGPTCGVNVLRHMISVGLGWHERPLLF